MRLGYTGTGLPARLLMMSGGYREAEAAFVEKR